MPDPLVRGRIVVGENTAQVLKKAAATLPGEALNIRNLVAEVVGVRTEVIPGEVIVHGVIQQQIFYVGKDSMVRQAVEETPFSTVVSVPEAGLGNQAEVTSTVAFAKADLISSNTVQSRILVDLTVRVNQTEPLVLAASATGPMVLVDRVVGEDTIHVMEEATVTLEKPATVITEVEAEFQDLAIEVLENQVMVQGNIHKKIYCFGTDNVEGLQTANLPFQSVIDLPGARPGMKAVVDAERQVVRFELKTPTELLETVVFQLFVVVTEPEKVRVIPNEGPLMSLEQVRGENTSQTLLESEVTLGLPAAEVREVTVSVDDLAAEVISGRVIIQGVLGKQVLYIGKDSVEYHQFEADSFGFFVDVTGAETGQKAMVLAEVSKVVFELENEKTLRQQVLLNTEVTVTETTQMQVRTLELPPNA